MNKISNKLVGNVANTIYEPRGRINTNSVSINNIELPCKETIQQSVIKYVLQNPKYKRIFIHSIPISIVPFLCSKLPPELMKIVYQFVDDIKKNIFHLMYNHWHRQLRQILLTMKGDEYVFDSLCMNNNFNWIQRRNIQKDIEEKEEYLEDIFKDILRSI